MAVALGKPVAAIVPEGSRRYEDKVAAAFGLRRDARGLAWDERHGLLIEEFGQPLNLMLSRSTAWFADESGALEWLATRLASTATQARRPPM